MRGIHQPIGGGYVGKHGSAGPREPNGGGVRPDEVLKDMSASLAARHLLRLRREMLEHRI